MSTSDDAQSARSTSSLDDQSAAVSRQTSRGSVPGAPTWPEVGPDSLGSMPTLAVGLNWQTVAEALDLDRRVLQHDGLILVAGEYFPAPGYFFDPGTLRPRRVGVGDVALVHGYFIGQATLRQFNLDLDPNAGERAGYRQIIPTPGKGQIIGLFVDFDEAARTKARLLRGALGAGITVERGALGTELRVPRPQQPGRVASVIAAHGGSVIAIDGVPTSRLSPARGPIATGDGRPGQQGDARRSGIGVTSGSAGPEVASSMEAGQGHFEEFTGSH